MHTQVKTTCPYCGVGCGVIVSSDGNGDYSVKGDDSHPSNYGRLCSKGSALAETIDLEGRLLYPEIKGQRVSWDTALDTVAKGFQKTIDQHGADAVAFYVSGQLLTEDYYVANKLMKGFIGSANIDTNSRLCMSTPVAGHKRAFGMDTVANCYEDLEIADLIVLIGSNAAWCHPVLYQRIKAAAKNRDSQRIIVIDPRRTASCDGAWMHLPIRPGTDAILFNGLLNYLVENNCHDADYIEQHTEHFDAALQASNNAYNTIKKVATACDLSEQDVEKFYQAFAQTPRTISLFSQGVNQSTSGTDKVNCIINCHLATGRIGKHGAGAFSITGQPNAMGGREVGGLANTLAAHMEFSREGDVDRVRRFWNAPSMAKKPGLKVVELIDAIDAGKVKAIWIIATNPAVSVPDANKVRAALKKCDLVVVSDCIRNTDTTSCADVLLPASAWGEKSGTVTNSERRISRQRRFLPTAGSAAEDWWIVTEVAQRMGFSEAFPYQSAADIFREHAALSGFENSDLGKRDFNISGLQNVSDRHYDAMSSFQWPVTDAVKTTPRLLGDGQFFTRSGKAQFVPISYILPRNLISEKYPLLMNTGRVRDHWHSLTRTGKAPRLSRHIVEPFASINPETSKQLKIADNELVHIKSAKGRITVRAQVNDSIRQNEVFVPFHWNDQFASDARVDSLVFPETDPVSGQPEFKTTPVCIERSNFQWHGFLMTRDVIDYPQTNYWVKAREDQFWRYELAGNIVKTDWSQGLHEILGDETEHLDRIEYTDTGAGRYRSAWFISGKLQGCFFAAPDYNDLPSRDWLLTQFNTDSFDYKQRLQLLAGHPADPAADTGPVVCCCFNIGENTLINAIQEQSLSNVEAIGQSLKAGTNCGSCIPELKTLLNDILQQT